VRKTALACLQIMLRVLGIYEGKRAKFEIIFIILLIFHKIIYMHAKSLPAVDWLTFQGLIMFGPVLRNSDKWHFGKDPDPRIHASDQWIRILLFSSLAL
jgi:hypothetical protein